MKQDVRRNIVTRVSKRELTLEYRGSSLIIATSNSMRQVIRQKM
jgi:hypothetical protein